MTELEKFSAELGKPHTESCFCSYCHADRINRLSELRTRVQELEETVTTLRGLYSGLREAVADGITDGCMCQVQHGGYYTVRCKPHEILAELDKLGRDP